MIEIPAWPEIQESFRHQHEDQPLSIFPTKKWDASLPEKPYSRIHEFIYNPCWDRKSCSPNDDNWGVIDRPHGRSTRAPPGIRGYDNTAMPCALPCASPSVLSDAVTRPPPACIICQPTAQWSLPHASLSVRHFFPSLLKCREGLYSLLQYQA